MPNVLSGSISNLTKCCRAEKILHKTMDSKRVKLHNGAVPGTLSSYSESETSDLSKSVWGLHSLPNPLFSFSSLTVSVCHNVHVPRDSDIVLLDYTINDPEPINPPYDTPVRKPFERLIRKLLNYPKCAVKCGPK